MKLLYWLFGVDRSLRESLPSLSVHDAGIDRGWTFVLALLCLMALVWIYRRAWPHLEVWQGCLLAFLRWGFLLGVFFVLVRPVLILSGEQTPGLPEVAKIELSSSLWILVGMLLLLCGEWWARRTWRLQ